LQVNPFAYSSRHSKHTSFQTESEYNAAIIAACQENGIEVKGVTDHYRVAESTGLVKAARAARIFAFSGFEAVSTDGVHFLCLFDPDKDNVLERFIGECGIRDTKRTLPQAAWILEELLKYAKDWGAACIAAHVVADQGGLLRKLSGQTRVKVWKSDLLLACAISGPVASTPDGIRQILENQRGEYYRSRPVAVINACDVSSPEDLKKDGASCFIKMSQVSVEALRQAFLDPESRIRLNSDPAPEPHAEFVAMSWESDGFLERMAVHFSENLNVLVGGRGTGKSTIIGACATCWDLNRSEKRHAKPTTELSGMS
jgi:hypothetical protein